MTEFIGKIIFNCLVTHKQRNNALYPLCINFFCNDLKKLGMLFQVASSPGPDGKYLVFRNTRDKFHRRHRTCFYQLSNISNLFFPHVAWTSPDWSFTWTYFFTSAFILLGTCLNSKLRHKHDMKNHFLPFINVRAII